MNTIDKMVKLQEIIESKADQWKLDGYDSDTIAQAVLIEANKLDMPYKAFTYVLSWAIDKYC